MRSIYFSFDNYLSMSLCYILTVPFCTIFQKFKKTKKFIVQKGNQGAMAGIIIINGTIDIKYQLQNEKWYKKQIIYQGTFIDKHQQTHQKTTYKI